VSKTKPRPRIALFVDEEICKGCGLCAAFCPMKAIRLAEHMNTRGFHPAALLSPDDCTGCARCALMCPDACIRIERSR